MGCRALYRQLSNGLLRGSWGVIEEKENEEGVADIVPGVEVEEDAGTIQLPAESRPVNFYRLNLKCQLFLGHFHHIGIPYGNKVCEMTCSQQLPGPGSSPLRSIG